MTQNIELYLLKSLFDYSFHQKYRDSLDVPFLKANHPELYRLYVTIGLFHEKFPEKSITSVEELEVFYQSQFPATSQRGRDELHILFERLARLTTNESVAVEYFAEGRRRNNASRIAFLGLEVAEGKKTYDELITASEGLSEGVMEGDYTEFVSDDAEAILEKIKAPGLRWRLDSLNEMLGPLRKGDFGFIFARPETGKTTFLADQITAMAAQASGPILWFNNEQAGEVVLARCQQACFGITSQELFSNYPLWRERFREETGGKIYIYDSANINFRDVDRICRKYSPALIIFDQIDKIKGLHNERQDRHDLELKALYQWARELAKEYGPVIGVCQAGATGEGKKYLTMDDVDSSKTAKQGEADWILGIGKSNAEGMDSLRHFHLCKNKLFGDASTNPTLRHGKRDVLLFPQIARYKDVA